MEDCLAARSMEYFPRQMASRDGLLLRDQAACGMSGKLEPGQPGTSGQGFAGRVRLAFGAVEAYLHREKLAETHQHLGQ